MINPFKYKIIPHTSIITNAKHPDRIITEKIYYRRNRKDKYLHKVYVNNKLVSSFLGYWRAESYIDEYGYIHIHTDLSI